MRNIVIVCWLTLAASGFVGPTVVGQDFMSKSEITASFADNTLQFPDRRSGDTITIYVRQDGSYRMNFRGRYRGGRWWVEDGHTFCRQYNNETRRRCARPVINGNTVSFYHAKEPRKIYEATLMDGNQLP